MAYDPEARETSNSAMIISIVVLVLAVGAAIAYFTSRPNDTDVAVVPANPTTVVERETVREVPVPSGNSAPTTVVVPQPKTVVVPGPSTTTRTEVRNNRTETRVVSPPAKSDGSSGGSTTPRVDVNTNVNVQPPAGGTATGGDAAAGNAAGGDTAGNSTTP